MADTGDLKSPAARREGSSPSTPTKDSENVREGEKTVGESILNDRPKVNGEYVDPGDIIVYDFEDDNDEIYRCAYIVETIIWDGKFWYLQFYDNRDPVSYTPTFWCDQHELEYGEHHENATLVKAPAFAFYICDWFCTSCGKHFDLDIKDNNTRHEKYIAPCSHCPCCGEEFANSGEDYNIRLRDGETYAAEEYGKYLYDYSHRFD